MATTLGIQVGRKPGLTQSFSGIPYTGTNLGVTTTTTGGGGEAQPPSGAAGIMAARARDPKWNMRGASAYPDQYAMTGHGKSVTDAINAGETVQPWAASSGIGGTQGSFGQGEQGGAQESLPTGRPAGEIHGARTADEYYAAQAQRPPTSKIRPLAPTFGYAHGTGQPVPPGMPFIAGDAQEDGKPNEELILPTPQGTHVIPVRDIPKHGDGTGTAGGTVSVKDKGQDTIRPKTSGLKPPTSGLTNFYKLNPNTPTAAGKEAEKLILNPQIPMPIRVPKLSKGTRHWTVDHHRGEDTRAPVSRAGRTGGLSQFYHNQTDMNLERGARGARDPITGMSQTPTEREIADQINMLRQKGEEFPGYSGEDEALLLHRYYQAKRSGDPEYLAEAAQAVTAYKDRLNALRGQQQRSQPQQGIAQQAGVQPHQSIASQAGAPAPAMRPPTSAISLPDSVGDYRNATGEGDGMAPPAPPPAESLSPPPPVGRTASIPAQPRNIDFGTGTVTDAGGLNNKRVLSSDFGTGSSVTPPKAQLISENSEPDAMPEMPRVSWDDRIKFMKDKLAEIRGGSKTTPSMANIGGRIDAAQALAANTSARAGRLTRDIDADLKESNARQAALKAQMAIQDKPEGAPVPYVTDGQNTYSDTQTEEMRRLQNVVNQPVEPAPIVMPTEVPPVLADIPLPVPPVPGPPPTVSTWQEANNRPLPVIPSETAEAKKQQAYDSPEAQAQRLQDSEAEKLRQRTSKYFPRPSGQIPDVNLIRPRTNQFVIGR